MLQDEVDTPAAPPARGMRGIMQRALQQARAEAAVQAQGTLQLAHGSGTSQAHGVSRPEAAQPPAAGKDKKALGALLKKAAQKMQQEDEGNSATAAPTSMHNVVQQPVAQQTTAAQLNAGTPAESAEGLLESRNVSLSEPSDSASESSSTELLPPTRPARVASLGQKLGSMLRSTLSLSRQSSYVPFSGLGRDALEGLDAAAGDGPGLQRSALPRAVSYLPEWVNRPFNREPKLASPSPSSARSSADFRESNTGLSRAGSTLPEWVDVSVLQQAGQSADPQETKQLHAVQQTEHPQAPAASLQLFTKALKPVSRPVASPDPPAPLITAPSWPPTEAQASAATSGDSRGKRLLAFWQQSAALGQSHTTQANVPAAASSQQSRAMTQASAAAPVGQMPAVNQPPLHAVHAHSRDSHDSGLKRHGLDQAQRLLEPQGVPLQHTSAMHCCSSFCTMISTQE